MAATYTILVSHELLQRGVWPRSLHLSKETLAPGHPGMLLVQVLDDDAPEELDGKRVELVIKVGRTSDDEPAGYYEPEVIERRVISCST